MNSIWSIEGLQRVFQESFRSLPGVFQEYFRSLSGIYRYHIYSAILSYKTLQKDYIL